MKAPATIIRVIANAPDYHHLSDGRHRPTVIFAFARVPPQGGEWISPRRGASWPGWGQLYCAFSPVFSLQNPYTVRLNPPLKPLCQTAKTCLGLSLSFLTSGVPGFRPLSLRVLRPSSSHSRRRPALHVPCVHCLQGGPRGSHMFWDMPKYIAAAKGHPLLGTDDVRGEPRLVARESCDAIIVTASGARLAMTSCCCSCALAPPRR